MVNKNALNAQNLRGRNLAVEWVLEHAEDDEMPCMEGFGSEVSIFKSAYVKTGLYKRTNKPEAGIKCVLSLMNAFVKSCEGEAFCIGDMYDQLIAPPYGLRKGIIPLLFAYAIREYKDEIVLTLKDKEVGLSSAILSAINDNPYDYYLFVERGTAEKDTFIDELLELFNDYSKGTYASGNKTQLVVSCMQNWIRSLPEYTKKCLYLYRDGDFKPVDNSIKVVRTELIKFEINSRELLFDIWKNKLSQSGALVECVQEIRRVKKFLDNHISEYKHSLTSYLIAVFAPGYNGSLSRAAKLWFDNLPKTTKQHIFDSNTNTLLNMIGQRQSFDDIAFVEELALMYTSMSIEDWSDELAKSFMEQIETSINKVNAYDGTDSETSGESLINISIAGTQISKSFNESEISPLGKTVLNNLQAVLDEYNDSIENDEKLSIIAKLLSDIIR